MIDPMQHLGLVRSVVRAYAWAIGPALEQSDLEQEGIFGVMKAAESFDPKKGKFSTHAYPWIRHYVQRLAHRQSRAVRVPMPVAVAAYKRGEAYSLTAVRLDAPSRINGHDAKGSSVNSILDSLTWLGAVNAEGPENVEASERAELVAHMLSTLTEREQTVLRLRFFEDMTLHETGRRIGLTKERTRQIQNEALRQIERRLARQAAE